MHFRQWFFYDEDRHQARSSSWLYWSTWRPGRNQELFGSRWLPHVASLVCWCWVSSAGLPKYWIQPAPKQE